MRVLTLSTIYPNEIADSEGSSVAFLDQSLADCGVQGTTLVLRPWAPRWLALRHPGWQHLAVRNRVEVKQNYVVVYDHYLHIPRRYRLDWSAKLMAVRAKAIIDKHKWQFDVIHGQSIYPAALVAYELAKLYNCPFAITLRDDLSHLDHMLRNNLHLRRLYERMFAQVGAILVHGPAILRDVSRFIPAGRSIPVLLAANGVDFQGIHGILSSLPALIPSPRVQIVSVSSLYRFKGIHENLLAMDSLLQKQIDNWHYTIVGNGPYRTELENMVRDLRLTDHVTFAGRVSHAEAIQFISRADIFCLPSFLEPFGNVYAEAAVCKKPAIGCHGQGAEIVIEPDRTGLLVKPQDADSLVQALSYLIAHPAEAREMGKNASQHIRNFTWEYTGQLYYRTFLNLISPTQETYSAAAL